MEVALAVGGALLSPAFQVLLDKLTSMDLINYARQGRVLDELKKWEKMLKKIYAVLDDAEEKQMTNELVKIWVAELRDLAYDVDDILDDFNTEAQIRKLKMEPTPSKVKKCIPTCFVGLKLSSVKFNAEILSKIERVTSRFDSIIKEKDSLHLEEGAKGRTNRVKGRSPTTSVVNEAKVYGREKDKKAILDLMKAETCSAQVSVIPIVGMGGVGKTTLAQLIFNDTTLEFDLKAWVSVGEDFDVSRITKTILQSKDCDNDDLNSLQVKLKEKLSRNKFLVVLDDVWTDNYDDWTLFHVPFEAGAPGSRIIITTRSEVVASKMGTVPAYILPKLSYADCLSIFAQHALGTTSFDAHLDLKDIGEDIADRCSGLPLAAKTLGGLLRNKTNPNAWKEVLKSKIWDLPEESGILPALRLSYHHLPSHLKRCFSYCAIFPKDYKFHKHELVLLWMAEGLLMQSKRKKKVEDVGLEYFDELLSRSFFERSSDGESFEMHDLINDLAQFVAGETCFDLMDDLGSSQVGSDYDKVRHMTFTHWTEETSKKLEILCKMKHLRTFAVLSGFFDRFTDAELNILLPELNCLRVLSLERTHIKQLPSLIGQLKHLRYVNLSHTDIKQLPESVGALLNLQSLLLCGCEELTTLPRGIKNLIRLQILDIVDTKSLQEMPAGVGNLISLQALAKFTVAKGDGLRVRELKDLLHLQGKLSIQRLHNVVDVEDAKVANLKNKDGLRELKLEWSEDFSNSRNERDETLVLELLQPPKNLEKLTITFFGGTGFPTWLGDQLFEKLVWLELINCKNSMMLPSLGTLPLLRLLSIKGAEKVRTVGVEFYGDNSPSGRLFRSLKTLKFENMAEWEHWACSEISFPCLCELQLQNCPKLRGALPRNLPSLEHLHITACPKLEDSLTVLPSLCTLYLEECNDALLRGVLSLSSLTSLELCRISGLACLNGRLVRTLQALKVLKVQDCSELAVLWEDGAKINNLVCLERLEIKNCPNLEFFTQDEQSFLSNLKNLVLEECENLEKLPNGLHGFRCLTDLRIKNCSKLRSFPETGLPLTLTYLKLIDPHEKPLEYNPFPYDGTGLGYWSGNPYYGYPYGYSASYGYPYPYYYPHYYGYMNEESQEKGTMSVYISDGCQLESLLQSMVCNNIKRISFPTCLNLKCLTQSKQNLNHLQRLTVNGCLGEESSITMSEWGLPELSSLQHLDIDGIEMVSFPDDDCKLLPTSLKHLSIKGMKHLESISRGILNLNCLEQLEIVDCKMLSVLPKEGLPFSLQRLEISGCPTLEKRCSQEKGDYWSIISHIQERHVGVYPHFFSDENTNACVIQ